MGLSCSNKQYLLWIFIFKRFCSFAYAEGTVCSYLDLWNTKKTFDVPVIPACFSPKTFLNISLNICVYSINCICNLGLHLNCREHVSFYRELGLGLAARLLTSSPHNTNVPGLCLLWPLCRSDMISLGLNVLFFLSIPSERPNMCVLGYLFIDFFISLNIFNIFQAKLSFFCVKISAQQHNNDHYKTQR